MHCVLLKALLLKKPLRCDKVLLPPPPTYLCSHPYDFVFDWKWGEVDVFTSSDIYMHVIVIMGTYLTVWQSSCHLPCCLVSLTWQHSCCLVTHFSWACVCVLFVWCLCVMCMWCLTFMCAVCDMYVLYMCNVCVLCVWCVCVNLSKQKMITWYIYSTLIFDKIGEKVFDWLCFYCSALVTKVLKCFQHFIYSFRDLEHFKRKKQTLDLIK